eukprot:EG_transcript_8466
MAAVPAAVAAVGPYLLGLGLVLVFPAVVLYGVCLPLLWLVDWLHPAPSSPPFAARGKSYHGGGSATACNATSFDGYYLSLRRDCLVNALKYWWACPSHLPANTPQYSPAEQAANLRAMARWHLCYQWLRRFPGFPAVLRSIGLKVWTTALQLPPYDPGAVLQFYDALAATTRSFAQHARTVTPHLDDAALFGAVRLLWFIAAFQAISKRRVALDAALASYCLIYPLTDNYLDDPTLTVEDKHAFNRRLKCWIREGSPDAPPAVAVPGVRPDPGDLVCRMLREMAAAWPRRQHQVVHFSLNAIHTAQTQSVAQCGGFERCSDSFLEEVSAMKGGASLLAAGCLVLGGLTPMEQRYLQYLGLGFQLLDDLQDVQDDLRERRCTLFTRAVHRHQPLDDRLARLLQYIAHPLANGWVTYPCQTLPDYLLLAIGRVSTLLALEAAAQMQELLSPDFCLKLERLSPVPLSALKAFNFEARLYDVMLSETL